MNYINTTSCSFSDYINGSSNTFIKCPPFSKILDIQVRNYMLNITYQSPDYVNVYNSNFSDFKTFNFIVLVGLTQNNKSIPDFFEYFDTIKVFEDERVEYYHVFIQEIKTIQEIRDGKIDELMDQEF